MLGIVMTDDGNIVDLGKAMETAVASVQSELPYGVELERVADQPTVVSESVWEFERSLLEALAIVLVVCLISLGWRTGIVVGLSVPIVLGVVALVMLAMGWNLERVSLGSLIIALGLLVDDGIIAVEMMVVKMEDGWERVKAAAFSYAATAMPRLTGALITAAAFMPVGFSKSTTGEYAGRHLLDRRHRRGVLVVRVRRHHALSRGEDAARLQEARSRRRPVPDAVLQQASRPDRPRHLAALVGHRLHRRRICPGHRREAGSCRSSSSRTATGPNWSSSCGSRKALRSRRRRSRSRRWRRCSRRTRTSSFFTAYTGAGQPRFYLALNPELPNPGYAVFVVMTKDLDARERVRSRLMASVNEQFPNVWVRVTRLELGPPVGFPVQFRIVGPGHAEGARDRARGRSGRRCEPQGPRCPARLERPRSKPPSRPRPGQGAGARPRARRRRVRHADVHEWRDAVAAARARRPGRHRRARSALRATQSSRR